jgi:hypothetical protein
MKIGTIGKQQVPFVFCNQKIETANFRLFAANENGTQNLFSSVGKRSTEIDDLLFQETCPSMGISESFECSASQTLYIPARGQANIAHQIV